MRRSTLTLAAALTVGALGLAVAAAGPSSAATTTPDPSSSLVLIAHRGGGGGTANESNPAALLQTYRSGVKSIELDVWINKEGREFILHDSTLDRTTDCTGVAVSKTIAQLKACGVMELGTALYLIKKYSFTAYLHQKMILKPAQAKEIAREVSSRKMNTSQVRFVADEAPTLIMMDKYVDHRRLGLLINRQAEWSDTRWADLLYYRGPITVADVDAAAARGQRVTLIQNPTNPEAVDSLEDAKSYGPGVWGWLFNSLESTSPEVLTED